MQEQIWFIAWQNNIDRIHTEYFQTWTLEYYYGELHPRMANLLDPGGNTLVNGTPLTWEYDVSIFNPQNLGEFELCIWADYSIGVYHKEYRYQRPRRYMYTSGGTHMDNCRDFMYFDGDTGEYVYLEDYYRPNRSPKRWTRFKTNTTPKNQPLDTFSDIVRDESSCKLM